MTQESLEDKMIRQLVLRERIRDIRSTRYVGMGDAKRFIDAVDGIPEGLEKSREGVEYKMGVNTSESSLLSNAYALQLVGRHLSKKLVDTDRWDGPVEILSEAIWPLEHALAVTVEGKIKNPEHATLLDAMVTTSKLPEVAHGSIGAAGATAYVQIGLALGEHNMLDALEEGGSLAQYRRKVLAPILGSTKLITAEQAREAYLDSITSASIAPERSLQRLARDQLAHRHEYRRMFVDALIDDLGATSGEDISHYKTQMQATLADARNELETVQELASQSSLFNPATNRRKVREYETILAVLASERSYIQRRLEQK